MAARRKEKPETMLFEVWRTTHKKFKVQSAMRDMTMREYLNYLVEQDEKEIMKRING